MLNSTRKSLFAFALSAAISSLLAAGCGGGQLHSLTTYQAASLAIGQADLVSGRPNQGGGPAASSFDSPAGMALTPEGGLLVADTGNNRILFYAAPPREPGVAATAVFGQAAFQSGAASVSRTGLSGPAAVAVGMGRMAVADTGANRVLIYDRIPAAGQPMPVPSVVIGQSDFNSSVESCGAFGLNRPTSVAITYDGKLVVADWANYRILVWNTIPAPESTAPAPDLVLGQSDAEHCAFADDDQDGESDRDRDGFVARTVNGRLMSPVSIWSDGLRLVVADSDFERVLVWHSFPTRNFQPADLVLGQQDFTGRWPNGFVGPLASDVPPTARGFDAPRGVHSDGTSLAVADLANNRVLVWSEFPTETYQPADLVLGHPGFDRSATDDMDGDGHPDAPNAQVFDRPVQVMFSSDALFVSDARHHRVLMFRRR